MNSGLRVFLVALLTIAGLVTGFTAAAARHHAFATYGVSIDVPDTGWIVIYPNEPVSGKDSMRVILRAVNDGETRAVVMTVSVIPRKFGRLELNGPLMRQFLAGIRSTGAEIVDSGIVTVDGHDAMRATFAQTSAQGGTVRTTSYFILLGRYAVGLSVQTLAGRPEDDAELAAILRSFEGTPMESGATRSEDIASEGGASEDAAFEAGRWAVPLIVLLGLAGAAVAVFVRRNKRAPQEDEDAGV